MKSPLCSCVSIKRRAGPSLISCNSPARTKRYTTEGISSLKAVPNHSALRKENVMTAAQRGEGLGARLAAGGVSSVQSGHMVSLGKLRANVPAFASWTISNASSNEYRPASARRFVYP
jgi:hypothetical protein